MPGPLSLHSVPPTLHVGAGDQRKFTARRILLSALDPLFLVPRVQACEPYPWSPGNLEVVGGVVGAFDATAVARGIIDHYSGGCRLAVWTGHGQVSAHESCFDQEPDRFGPCGNGPLQGTPIVHIAPELLRESNLVRLIQLRFHPARLYIVDLQDTQE